MTKDEAREYGIRAGEAINFYHQITKEFDDKVKNEENKNDLQRIRDNGYVEARERK